MAAEQEPGKFELEFKRLAVELYKVAEPDMDKCIAEYSRRRQEEPDKAKAARISLSMVAVETGVLSEEQAMRVEDAFVPKDETATIELPPQEEPQDNPDDHTLYDPVADTIEDTSTEPGWTAPAQAGQEAPPQAAKPQASAADEDEEDEEEPEAQNTWEGAAQYTEPHFMPAEQNDAAADTVADTGALFMQSDAAASAASGDAAASDDAEVAGGATAMNTGPLFMPVEDDNTLPQPDMATGPLLLPGQEMKTMNLVPDEAPTITQSDETKTLRDVPVPDEVQPPSLSSSEEKKVRRFKFRYRFFVGLTMTSVVAALVVAAGLYIPPFNRKAFALLKRLTQKQEAGPRKYPVEGKAELALVKVALPGPVVLTRALADFESVLSPKLTTPDMKISLPKVADETWMESVKLPESRDGARALKIELPAADNLYVAAPGQMDLSYSAFRVEQIGARLKDSVRELGEQLAKVQTLQKLQEAAATRAGLESLAQRDSAGTDVLDALDALFAEVTQVKAAGKGDDFLRFVDKLASAFDRSKGVYASVDRAAEKGVVPKEAASSLAADRKKLVASLLASAVTISTEEWNTLHTELKSLLPDAASDIPSFAEKWKTAGTKIGERADTYRAHSKALSDLSVEAAVKQQIKATTAKTEALVQAADLLAQLAPCMTQAAEIRRQRETGEETTPATLEKARELITAADKLAKKIDLKPFDSVGQKAVAALQTEVDTTVEDYTRGVPDEVKKTIKLCEKWTHEPWHPTSSFDEVLTGFIEPPLQCNLDKRQIEKTLKDSRFTRYNRLMKGPYAAFESSMATRTAEWKRVREYLRRLPRVKFLPANWSDWVGSLNRLAQEKEYWGRTDPRRAGEDAVPTQGLLLAVIDYMSPERKKALELLKAPPATSRDIIMEMWYWGNVRGTLDKLPASVYKRLGTYKLDDGKTFLAPIEEATNLAIRKMVRLWTGRTQEDKKVLERLVTQMNQYKNELAYLKLDRLMVETQSLSYHYVDAPWFKSPEKKWWSWLVTFTVPMTSEDACEELAVKLYFDGVPVNRMRIRRDEGLKCTIISGFWREQKPAEECKTKIERALTDLGKKASELKAEESSPDF